MEKIKEWAPLVLSIVTLLLVGSIKMDTCQAKKGHRLMKDRPAQMEFRRGSQRGMQRSQVAPKGDDGRWQRRGSRGDRGEGAWKKPEKKIN
jgi:hypothetical protein